jgi:hypothetical protein
MNWTTISLYDGTMTYWISGIYKIVCYDNQPAFHAYYIRDSEKNWGWYVCHPPVQFGDYSCWSSLESAKRDCELHSQSHTPKASTVRRAAEILDSFTVEVAA